MRGLITAIRTLTIIPIPGRESENLSEAVAWFPLVGFLIGVILILAARVCMLILKWSEFTALLLILLSAILTRGIHLDGLADCADGMGGGYTKKQTLTIMKDPNIGSFGTVALILDMGFKWLFIEKLIAINALWLILPAYTNSRLVMSYLSVFLPYARKEDGTGKPFVEDSKSPDFMKALAIALAANGILFSMGGVFLTVISVASGALLGIFYEKKVGGITGDLLGAASEITELVTLLAAILIIMHMPETLRWHIKP